MQPSASMLTCKASLKCFSPNDVFVVLGGSSHADVCSFDHFDLQVGLSEGGRWPGCAERFLTRFLMFSSADSSQGTSCALTLVRRTSTLVSSGVLARGLHRR